jgi:hypothetical protein
MGPPEADSELLSASSGREQAVRFVGSCFVLLAVVAAVLGLGWVAGTLRAATRLGPVQNETFETLKILAAPVLLSAFGCWSLFGVGRGVLRRSAFARWAAVALLVSACIPPLVLFFSAVRNGAHSGAALAIGLLIPPAAGAWLLSGTKTDRLFRPKGQALVADLPEAGVSTGMAAKFFLMAIGVVVMIVLLVMSR